MVRAWEPLAMGVVMCSSHHPQGSIYSPLPAIPASLGGPESTPFRGPFLAVPIWQDVSGPLLIFFWREPYKGQQNWSLWQGSPLLGTVEPFRRVTTPLSLFHEKPVTELGDTFLFGLSWLLGSKTYMTSYTQPFFVVLILQCKMLSNVIYTI